MASSFVSTPPQRRPSLPRHAVALAVLACLSAAASAQTATPSGSDAAPATVTVTGSRGNQPASVAGFGDVPLSQLPLSATVITRTQLADAGIAALADITRLDADITDAYNAPGYIHQLAVRGFTLDNRYNLRRDGLPINGETVIGQANKQALELLKGTSGLQAGTSAPGGLLNLVVKRPGGRIRDAALSWTQPGTWEAEADLGDRAGANGSLGWRVNASATRLDPQTRDSRGERHLLAAAGDLRLGTLFIEAEVEASRQRQPSTPGFSLLGDRLPSAASIDPRLNLNRQPWTLPVVFDGTTGSLRVTQDLGDRGELTLHLMRQALRTDDRIAFPYGCSAENRYDRYCSDGTYDLYDFRSEDERRTTDAVQLRYQGLLRLGGVSHRLAAGILSSRLSARFQRQAFNYVGTGTPDGTAVVAPDPSLTDENTNRTERSLELHLQDAMALDGGWTVWAGARHTRLDRQSVRTDGSRATDILQSFTTPWLAASWQLTGTAAAGSLLYASWGEGVESEVAPNRARYVNAGQALPALRSRQTELGWKHRQGSWGLRAAAFDIRRPAWNDILVSSGQVSQDSCSNADPCRRTADGIARHRGVDAEVDWQSGPLSLRASALWLQARREGSVDASLNGLRPTNVPARSLKAQAAWNLPQVPGLSLLAFVTHEGERMVLPDNSIATPGWTRLDLGLRWSGRWAGQAVTWRAALDNATDRRAWQEAPFQFGHAYLYPLAPRTARVSVETRF